MIVLPDAAKLRTLDLLITSFDTWFHLFVNDVEPGDDTLLADLVEPSWADYVPVRVTTWQPAVIVDHRAVTTADPVEFMRGLAGLPERVFGYFVTDGQSGPLLWLERVCGLPPVPMQFEGQTTLVWPRYTLPAEPEPACQYDVGVEVWLEPS